MNHNDDMIKLVKLLEGQQKYAGEEVGQKPGDQVRGTDKAKTGGKDHPFKGRLVGEDTTLEDRLAKKYQDFKDLQAKEKAEKKEKEELDEQGAARDLPPAGYGDYSKGATNPDGTASAQRQADREFDRREYERKEKERKNKSVAEAEPVPGKYSGHFYDAVILPNGDYKVVKINSKKDESGQTNPLNLSVGDVVPRNKAHTLQYHHDGGMFDQLKSVAEGGEAPEKELERLKLRQNAEHGRASLQRQAETQARIRELEKAQKNQGVAEGSEDLASLKAKASKISDKIDAIVKDGGRIGLDDPLSKQLKSIQAKIQQAKKQGVTEVGPVTIGSKLPKSDTATFGIEPGRGYYINNPKDWKKGDRPRAIQQLIPTQDKKDHIRSRLGKHKSPVLPEQDIAEGMNDSPVAGAITRRIMLQRTDLLSKYGPEKVLNAIDEVSDFVGDVEEIGSSDVSGWVRHVEQMLGNMEEGMTAEQKLSELGATPPTPPTGTATANPAATATANAAPTTGSVSPDEQTALNKIQTNPTMKAQLDKLMTQAKPAQTGQPMKLNPDQEDALEKIKANAGLKTQYDKIIQQANPQAKV